MHALPVRHRRPGNQAGAEKVWPQYGDHQGLVARLAIADGERTRCVWMERDYAFEKAHLSFDDIQKLLARHRYRPEADEINRVPRVERIADLAIGFETADARPLATAAR